MNQNLGCQTKLTQFAPLSPEEEETTSLGSLFSRWTFGFRRTPPEENKAEGADSEASNELPTDKQDVDNQYIKSKEGSEEDEEEIDDNNFENKIPFYLTEGRSLPNVLRRISNLLAVKNSGKQSYKDTDLKQYWMPDSVSKECYDCGEKFTTFRRRHHCRVCGQIFCSRCCNQEIPGKIMNCNGDLRVCTYCGKVVLSYLQSPDMAAHLSADLRALQEDLQVKFGDPLLMTTAHHGSNPSLTPDREDSVARRKPSLGYQEEKFANSRSDPGRSSMRCLLDEAVISGGLNISTHRYRLRTYSNCFLASQLVDWLVQHNKAASRIQGVVLGQAMLQSGYIECVSLDTTQFSDGTSLYRILPKEILQEEGRNDSSADSESEYVPSEASLKTSNSIFDLDLNLEEKTVLVSKPPQKVEEPVTDKNFEHSKKNSATDMIGDSGFKAVTDAYSAESEVPPAIDWHTIQENTLKEEDRHSYNVLKAAFSQHCNTYFRQLLNMQGVPQNWTEVLTPLVQRVAGTIRPEVSRLDDMDIRLYVQVKKVPGGERSECGIINGVVCSKNVAHRAMPTKIVNPKILLLNSAIMYQRVEGKYLSLEPVIMQEQEYVDRAVAKILGLGPNLVLVGKSVSRLAQESLLAHGITLVLNLKPSVLERVARITGADIITSVDPQLRSPRLGRASLFSVSSYITDTGRKKTLMMFEGCPAPHLGCTILLRGASGQELAKLKKVTKEYIFALYNSYLELSYLMDAEAQPPSPSDNVFEDSEGEIKSHYDENPHKRIRLEERNSEEVINSRPVSSEAVSDFSDPLRSHIDPEDETVSEKVTIQQEFSVSELPLCNKFRKALEENILSISPFLKFQLPYLETENGRNCPLRMFFGRKIYWSLQFSDEPLKPKCIPFNEPPSLMKRLESVKLKEVHELVKAKLTQSLESYEVQKLLAHYRATGGRLPLMPYETPQVKTVQSYSGPKDVLDPENHQRLSVLLSSYSPVSRVAPEFCVNPSIVEMEFYGRNDIALGAFLERYCFRFDCTSASCDVPMSAHTRRFVHSNGALNIKVRNLESPLPSAKILMWTWCPKCPVVTNIRCMSPATWSLSFAKYLELRFHGDMYTLRAKDSCNHSLHQECVQYFGLNNTLASFRFSKISIWEICFPPKILNTEREPFDERKSEVEEELKTYNLMISQFFNTILNKIMALPISETSCTASMISGWRQQLVKDQASFKVRVEDIQQKLSSSVDEKSSVGAIWCLDDMLVMLRRCFAATIDDWNSRLSSVEVNQSKKKDDKKKSLESRSSQNALNDFIEGIAEGMTEDNLETSECHLAEDTVVDLDDQKVPNDGTEIDITDLEDGDSTLQIATEIKPTVSDKKSVKTILSQLLPNSSNNIAVQSPLGQTEHYTLPLGYLMPIIVYEREPSSIIAYVLSSHDYKIAFEQLRTKAADQTPSSPLSKKKSLLDVSKDSSDTGSMGSRSGALSFLRTPSTGSSEKLKPVEGGQYSISPSDVFMEDETKEGKPTKNQSPYIEVSFSDSTASFRVKVFFPEDFNRLRSLVLPEGEEGYIRSLSRCVAWAASGGKSGSNFNKTKDDRFILKEMTRIETQIFVDFAPQYFTYMEACVKTKAPTLLGKILGVYRITCKSETTNTTFRSSLLVMEHLFHGRVVENKFDLKGSMRNRLVDTTLGAHRETVLLDENLMNMTCDDPLYILPHSKTVLMQAIQNDTQFLATQSVMDYSLLVGLDISNRELVVGIIDYIRTFTWDKKLETMVKRLGQGKQPTIISPDEYRKRFIAAMNRYFLPVPDRWAGLGLGID